MMRALISGTANGSAQRRWLFKFPRVGAFVTVGAGEVFLESFLFDYELPRNLSYWQNPILYANTFAKTVLVGVFLLALVLWPKRAVVEAHHSIIPGSGAIHRTPTPSPIAIELHRTPERNGR
jgi:hypothetical protein